jgi:hypothetical protein
MLKWVRFPTLFVQSAWQSLQSFRIAIGPESIGLQEAWNLISRIWWLAVQLSFLGQPTTWSTTSSSVYQHPKVHIDTGAGRGISICCSNYFHSDWQKLQELPAIAMLLLAIGTRFIHESPRFLAARGRTDEAGLGCGWRWGVDEDGQSTSKDTWKLLVCDGIRMRQMLVMVFSLSIFKLKRKPTWLLISISA